MALGVSFGLVASFYCYGTSGASSTFFGVIYFCLMISGFGRISDWISESFETSGVFCFGYVFVSSLFISYNGGGIG